VNFVWYRITPADSSSKLGEVDVSQELALTPLAMNYQGSDHDSVHSPGAVSSRDKDSRALFLVPAADPNAGAVVPANKTKRSPEQGHRRIRRPFSVAEVEALVLAVEKLGTGRYNFLYPLIRPDIIYCLLYFSLYSYGYHVGGEMLNFALLTMQSTVPTLTLR
jgi:hypothetical protein